MFRRSYLTFILILSLLVTGSLPALAETKAVIKIAAMTASIMPEYDTSDVLVLYAITFVNSGDKPFTEEIRFPVPKGSTNNIVKETAANTDTHIQVTVEDNGNYAELVWKPAQPIQPGANYPIHLEYYYNPLPGAGLKTFTYQFPANVPVDMMNFQIYQPLKATEFRIEPQATLLGQDNQGFQVYGLSKSLKPGEEVSLKISYNKSIPNPSIQNPSAGAPSQTTATGASQFASLSVLLPLGVIVLLIGAIGYKALTRNREEEETEEIEEEAEKETEDESYTPAQQAGSVNKPLAIEKRKVRDMLLSGIISEETYRELMSELEEEYK